MVKRLEIRDLYFLSGDTVFVEVFHLLQQRMCAYPVRVLGFAVWSEAWIQVVYRRDRSKLLPYANIVRRQPRISSSNVRIWHMRSDGKDQLPRFAASRRSYNEVQRQGAEGFKCAFAYVLVNFLVLCYCGYCNGTDSSPARLIFAFSTKAP